MMDLLNQVVTAFLTRVSDPLVLLCVVLCGYFAWDRYRIQKSFDDHQTRSNEAMDKLNTALSERHQDEKKQLIEIIDRYHDGQLKLNETLNQIRIVLSNVGGRT